VKRKILKNRMMKRIIFYLIATLFVTINGFAQKNEYRYIAIKFGASHGFSQTPGFNPNKYLNTPVGEMQISPVSSAYAPGFVFDFLYHFDFTSDNAGIYTGLEYNFGGIAAKYKANRDEYTLNETYRYHSVGVPLGFKFGPKIWDNQTYVFAGAQANMLLKMNSIQKVNFEGTSASVPLGKDEYNPFVFNLFLGLNYKAVNIQFDYYPKSYFNPLYTTTSGYKPYNTQVDKFFVLKTSINVPYGWLSDQSFWWRKFLRKTFWR
jgi:hypothetical protein